MNASTTVVPTPVFTTAGDAQVGDLVTVQNLRATVTSSETEGTEQVITLTLRVPTAARLQVNRH